MSGQVAGNGFDTAFPATRFNVQTDPLPDGWAENGRRETPLSNIGYGGSY